MAVMKAQGGGVEGSGDGELSGRLIGTSPCSHARGTAWRCGICLIDLVTHPVAQPVSVDPASPTTLHDAARWWRGDAAVRRRIAVSTCWDVSTRRLKRKRHWLGVVGGAKRERSRAGSGTSSRDAQRQAASGHAVGRQVKEGRIERCDESGSASDVTAPVEIGVKGREGEW